MKRLLLLVTMLTLLVGCTEQATPPLMNDDMPFWLPEGMSEADGVRARAQAFTTLGKVGDDDSPNTQCELAGPPLPCKKLSNDIERCTDVCGGVYYTVQLAEGQVCVGWTGNVYDCTGFMQ